MTAVIQKTIFVVENKEEVKLSCLDLRKAFDCVDHKILLQKIDIFGIRGPAFDISSYMYVSITDNKMWIGTEIYNY